MFPYEERIYYFSRNKEIRINYPNAKWPVDFLFIIKEIEEEFGIELPRGEEIEELSRSGNVQVLINLAQEKIIQKPV